MSHSTAFAGIYGAVATLVEPNCVVTTPRDESVLLDPSGSWGLRLHNLPADTARMLLQILRDTSPSATQTDSSLIRRVAAYDEACQQDASLLPEIERGLGALDVLARKLTRQNYLAVEQRPLRRSMLAQLAHQPLFNRLGVQIEVYAGAAV